MSIKKINIAIASDHAGFHVKGDLLKMLSSLGYEVVDFGTFSSQSIDYPELAFKVGAAVTSGQFDRGILACGSGIGMAMAANKVKGIRAAMCWSMETAKLAAIHNWCNVICLSGRFTSMEKIRKMVKVWLSTPYDKGGRHERRIKKILRFEAKK